MWPFGLVTTLLRLLQSCLRAPLIGDEHRALLVMAVFLLQRARECAEAGSGLPRRSACRKDAAFSCRRPWKTCPAVHTSSYYIEAVLEGAFLDDAVSSSLSMLIRAAISEMTTGPIKIPMNPNA